MWFYFNKTVFNCINSKSVISFCFLKEKSLCLGTSYKTEDTFKLVSLPWKVSMRCRTTQFARESVGLCPFHGSNVREFELSHSNRVNNYKNNSCTQFARENVGLWIFYNSYVKKLKLFNRKFSQTILRNHLGFTTSAIKLCFMQHQGW